MHCKYFSQFIILYLFRFKIWSNFTFAGSRTKSVLSNCKRNKKIFISQIICNDVHRFGLSYSLSIELQTILMWVTLDNFEFQCLTSITAVCRPRAKNRTTVKLSKISYIETEYTHIIHQLNYWKYKHKSNIFFKI